MNKRLLVFAAASVILIAGCSREKLPSPEYYDNIIVYGKIYTSKVDAGKAGTDRYVIADAMVVKDGKFEYVGTKDEADRYRTGKSRIIDCEGKGMIIPGITDGHAPQ